MAGVVKREACLSFSFFLFRVVVVEVVCCREKVPKPAFRRWVGWSLVWKLGFYLPFFALFYCGVWFLFNLQSSLLR